MILERAVGLHKLVGIDPAGMSSCQSSPNSSFVWPRRCYSRLPTGVCAGLDERQPCVRRECIGNMCVSCFVWMVPNRDGQATTNPCRYSIRHNIRRSHFLQCRLLESVGRWDGLRWMWMWLWEGRMVPCRRLVPLHLCWSPRLRSRWGQPTLYSHVRFH